MSLFLLNTFDMLYLLTYFYNKQGLSVSFFVEFVSVYQHANILNKISLYQAHTEISVTDEYTMDWIVTQVGYMSLSPVKLEIVNTLNDGQFNWWKSLKEMLMMGVCFLSINQLTTEHTYGFWNIRRNKACLLIHSKTPYSAWLSAAIILTIWTTLVHFFLWYLWRLHRKPLSSK